MVEGHGRTKLLAAIMAAGKQERQEGARDKRNPAKASVTYFLQ
jgi:hypothetical protein